LASVEILLSSQWHKQKLRSGRQVEHAQFGNFSATKQTPDGNEAGTVVRPSEPPRSGQWVEIGQDTLVSPLDDEQVRSMPLILLQDRELCPIGARFNPCAIERI